MYDLLYSRRHQQHYHSQRREHPRERQERPVSNFYEYESVQAAMHAAAAAQQSQTQSPPRGGNNVGSQQQHQHHAVHQPMQQPQHHHHHTNMSPPTAPGLVLHGQPIYGMTNAQLHLQQQQQQQNRLNNNNGITLPSPSGPFTVGMHQTSPSQFQVITNPVNNTSSRQLSSSTLEKGGTVSALHPSIHHQYPQSAQQRPKPNSLPRRHKGNQLYAHSYTQPMQSFSEHVLTICLLFFQWIPTYIL